MPVNLVKRDMNFNRRRQQKIPNANHDSVTSEERIKGGIRATLYLWNIVGHTFYNSPNSSRIQNKFRYE